jgi:hypothetical protein
MKVNERPKYSMESFLKKFYPEVTVQEIIQLTLENRPSQDRNYIEKFYIFNNAKSFTFSVAFTWSNTKQGHDYWRKISRSWTIYKDRLYGKSVGFFEERRLSRNEKLDKIYNRFEQDINTQFKKELV